MSIRATAVLIFLLTLWSMAALTPPTEEDDQVITRLALVTSIVDMGSVEISRFNDLTGDKALFNGHVYPDKTPGHPLLAVPIVAADKQVREALGLSTDVRDPYVFFDYDKWATIAVNGLLSAAATALLFYLALHLGASRAGAVFAAFALGLATPFFGWSTAFFAHSVTGSLLLIELAVIIFQFPGAGFRPALWKALLLGVLFGYTGVVDLTAMPAVAILGLFALIRVRRAGLLPVTAMLGIGGVLGLLPLLIYNHIAFGSPFHLGYSDTSFGGMQRGLFGITLPNPLVLLELLFGFYRGLLPLSPVLLAVPFGLAVLLKDPARRGPAIAVVLIVLAYFWINASYYYWAGGWSVGPRQIVAMLPLAALGLAFAWPSRSLPRVAVLVLLGVSLVISLACPLAGMFAPEQVPNEFTGWLLPRLRDPALVVPGILVLPAWIAFAVLLYRADRQASARTGSFGASPALAG